MLEAFGRDLVIVNVEWVPGSQTMLAVGTRQFVRIYDLAEDNISPAHNLEIINDIATNLTFMKHQICPEQPNKAKCNVLVSTKKGCIFIHELTYKLTAVAKLP